MTRVYAIALLCLAFASGQSFAQAGSGTTAPSGVHDAAKGTPGTTETTNANASVGDDTSKAAKSTAKARAKNEKPKGKGKTSADDKTSAPAGQ